MKKCKYCGQKNGVHKMGCQTRKITIMTDKRIATKSNG